ncbi:hypothetical protein [Synechococcus sp. MU1617]|uniref:hypothetical protein n=1 Tax=Synechococcus sp. MU1617 TaxID=2508346 RepID=UPI001CF8633B|nr:hypothetical protein [Synechococcus sp. MU1617]MCB4389386.1 hypothetical protein [Synechococcus sp. MU1617]
MGLPSAIRAHADKNLALAAKHYQRALDQKDYKPSLFQNYGALLREIGEVKKSKEIYELGLSIFPDELSIQRNYANLIVSEHPLKALPIYFRLLHEELALEKQTSFYFISISSILRSCNAFDWALEICRSAVLLNGLSPDLAIEIVKIFQAGRIQQLSDKSLADIEDIFANIFRSSPVLTQAEFHYSLSWLYFQNSNLPLAIKYLTCARSALEAGVVSMTQADANSAIKLNDVNSWNASTILLQNQDFELGWKLFDFGLRAKAVGPQAWQRALPKPFTHNQIPLWRGQSLLGKSLLVLEEQAVGDVMQFMSLIPTILEECSHVGILLSDRLLPIYKRSLVQYISNGSLSLYSFADSRNNILDSGKFDYQTPIGSICQYRFTLPQNYGNHLPCLIANSVEVDQLKSTYLDSASSFKSIVGISWRGGGTGSRIKQKSFPIEKFAQLISGFDDILFVNLQYGDCESALKKLRSFKINIISDDSINPLKNMDSWLSQVQICDAVISVANTTIHASGGLDIPTMCLLSQHSDWRWIKSPKVDQSYWYPSVGIARQNDDSSWDQAIVDTRSWLRNGTPIQWSTPFIV